MREPQALIVEDNEMNSEVLATLLDTVGIEAVVLPSPTRLLTTAEQMEALRVVFLDLQFPNANGFETNRALRAHDWRPDIPIVAYTVHISEMDRARREGFHSFLGKPIDPLQFPSQIEKILAGEHIWAIP